MTTTSTHDTKRDEDVRARIHVLSEIPGRWEQAIVRWREINRAHKTPVDEADAPDGNEEYLFYQTLVGAWPRPDGPGATLPADFVPRMQAYMEKALREAKVHTSWVNPNVEYEQAVRHFVAAALETSAANSFPADFAAFLASVLRPGLLNAVSQVVLKVASPGVPDFYQGVELPSFRLVDPDNRQPVDYDLRRWLLGELEADEDAAALADRLLEELDGRLKLWVTARALAIRRRRPELFRDGDYVPLEALGARARELVAFGRRLDTHAVIVAAGRFFTHLPARPAGAGAWKDTRLRWPGESGGVWREALTGHELRATGGEFDVAEVLRHLPVALLERTE